MARIAQSAADLIGNTPVVRLGLLQKREALEGTLLAKLECFNPAGSAKDRVGRSMIADAEAKGLIGPGSVIVEPTSGNTGIGLAAYAVARGYRVVLTMPETMSVERRQLLAAYGAELCLTDGAKGMPGAVERARQLVLEIPGAFMPCQFENMANPRAHYEATGPEIYEATDGALDAFVAGVGTGGTISGAGRYLKERIPGIRVVAVEPDRSAVISGAPKGPHGIQGIGAGFVPEALDRSVIDDIARVDDEDAKRTSRLIARSEGLLVGISSGAAVWAAMGFLRAHPGSTVLALLPDGGERYLSSGLFDA